MVGVGGVLAAAAAATSIHVSLGGKRENRANFLMKYLCLCISIYEQSLMDVLWCYRMDDGGGHCDIDQMLASQLAAPTLYFHSWLGQELLHNTFWGCNVCVWRIFMEILQQQQKSLF